MATVNERLLDNGIRHQVGVQRLAAGIQNRVLELIKVADDEIVTVLAQRVATLEGALTSQRLAYLTSRIEEINHAAYVEVGKLLRQELRDLAKYEAGFQTSMLQRALPFTEVEKVAASELTALVTSEPMKGRYLEDWLGALEDGRNARIMAAVRDGMNRGEAAEDIALRVRGTRALGFRDGVLNRNKRHAINLIRMATNVIATVAAGRARQANDDLLNGEQWVAALDDRTCVVCAGYDGEVFPVGEGPRPPDHPSCRCHMTPVVKSARQLGVTAEELNGPGRAALDGKPSPSPSFQEWLSEQSPAVQDQALGRSRGRLFRQGGLDVSRFTDARGNVLNLDALRELEGEAFERANLL
jgi:SPP1 gp7 family putative phage head morphogenesis protein